MGLHEELNDTGWFKRHTEAKQAARPQTIVVQQIKEKTVEGPSGCGLVVLGGSLGFLFLIYILTQFLPFLLAGAAGTTATAMTKDGINKVGGTKRFLVTIAAAGSAAFIAGDLTQRALEWGPYYVPSETAEIAPSAPERALPAGITMENCERYYSTTECAGIF